MDRSRYSLKIIALIIVLILGNLAFGRGYFISKGELKRTQSLVATEQTNQKVLTFSQLFVEKVLNEEGEVKFDTRLQLENAVRDINDQEILDHWNKFVDSKTQAEAQTATKNLLGILVKKIR